MDLDDSIRSHRAALALYSEGHPSHPKVLIDLAYCVSVRFQQHGQLEDLEESIALNRKALDLVPESHPRRSVSLHSLATALSIRFDIIGEMQDLEDSINFYRTAVALRPEGDPGRSLALNNLATTLHTRFEQHGRMHDLEEVISLHRCALDLRPEGHPDRSTSLSNLANSLWTRFKQNGRTDDLEESIALFRATLTLRPEDHPDHPLSPNNLASSLLTRFEQRGQMGDLEESIALYRVALALRPEGHPDRSISLNNLANTLLTRFSQNGQIDDLEEAILLYRDAMTLYSEDDPEGSFSLNNLASSLLTRFERSRKMGDLEESILLYRNALAHCPEGHFNRSSSLNNLANSLVNRFEQNGQVGDLEEVITLHRAALALRPEENPDRSSSLYNLANSLLTWFEHSGEAGDLEESIVLHRGALALRPEGHPDRSSSYNNLVNSLFARFNHNGHRGDLEECIQLLECAAVHPFSSLLTRLRIAVRWTILTRSNHHPNTIRAYRTALSLLARTLTIRPTLQMQHDLLNGENGYPTLVSDAASYAIEHGELTQAVEMLEQGRALIWSQLRGFRTPLNQLTRVNPELADDFLKTSRKLEALTGSSESAPLATIIDGVEVNAMDQMYSRRRILADKLESNIAKIRATPGFEDFLQTPRFSALQQAAIEGPVIILTHSAYRSDALIILYGRPPVCIELDSSFGRDSILWADKLQDVLRGVRLSPVKVDRTIHGVLGFLWARVVSLVVDKFNELGIEKQTRIWWCPTSHLSSLPFHAAGPMRMEGRKRIYLPDDYVSSYTPTLTALISARSGAIRSSGRPSTLVVSQLDATLPEAKREVHAIQKSRDWVDCLTGEQATREVIIDKLRDHRWIHLVCHGNLNPGEPFSHWFSLSNKSRLALLDIIQSQLPNAELAFLSACHSAASSSQSADNEVLNLAAAMQFSGFRSVVGTMWEMDDEDGPSVAKYFYKCMFEDEGEHADGFRRSASALREATQHLRRTKDMTLERWVNFVHIGA